MNTDELPVYDREEWRKAMLAAAALIRRARWYHRLIAPFASRNYWLNAAVYDLTYYVSSYETPEERTARHAREHEVYQRKPDGLDKMLARLSADCTSRS